MKVRPLPPVEILRDRFSYDPITGTLTWRKGPKVGRVAGSLTSAGYRMVYVEVEQFFAHRVIWKMQTGEDPEFIDHRDGHRDNNRWANLRSGSQSANMRNARLNALSRSGVNGVREIGNGIWRATISHAGRHFHLGCFLSKAEAVAARKAAEIVLGFAPEHGAADRPRYGFGLGSLEK